LLYLLFVSFQQALESLPCPVTITHSTLLYILMNHL
ncbi:hypothetical protein T09_6510, partial [Trichinella sp. T9]